MLLIGELLIQNFDGLLFSTIIHTMSYLLIITIF